MQDAASTLSPLFSLDYDPKSRLCIVCYFNEWSTKFHTQNRKELHGVILKGIKYPYGHKTLLINVTNT